jgi:hypothetical protein
MEALDKGTVDHSDIALGAGRPGGAARSGLRPTPLSFVVDRDVEAMIVSAGQQFDAAVAGHDMEVCVVVCVVCVCVWYVVNRVETPRKVCCTLCVCASCGIGCG